MSAKTWVEKLADDIEYFINYYDNEGGYLGKDEYAVLGEAVDILYDCAKHGLDTNTGDFYSANDCSGEQYYENRLLVLKPSVLTEAYRDMRYQLFYATSGFGCDPTKLGSKVYGFFIEDGEYTSFQRSDFVGVLKDSLITSSMIRKIDSYKGRHDYE